MCNHSISFPMREKRIRFTVCVHSTVCDYSISFSVYDHRRNFNTVLVSDHIIFSGTVCDHSIYYLLHCVSPALWAITMPSFTANECDHIHHPHYGLPACGDNIITICTITESPSSFTFCEHNLPCTVCHHSTTSCHCRDPTSSVLWISISFSRNLSRRRSRRSQSRRTLSTSQYLYLRSSTRRSRRTSAKTRCGSRTRRGTIWVCCWAWPSRTCARMAACGRRRNDRVVFVDKIILRVLFSCAFNTNKHETNHWCYHHGDHKGDGSTTTDSPGTLLCAMHCAVIVVCPFCSAHCKGVSPFCSRDREFCLKKQYSSTDDEHIIIYCWSRFPYNSTYIHALTYVVHTQTHKQ